MPPPDVPRGDASPQAAGPWYARPAIVFGALALVLAATLVLTPGQAGRGDMRLSTLSRQPHGARGLAEVAARTGWRVVRDSAVPGRGALPADVVYAVLDPPQSLTAREYSRVLDAVRRGAGLLVVHPGDGPLADTLGIARSDDGAPMRVDPAVDRACPKDEPQYEIGWAGDRVWSLWLVPKKPIAGDTTHWLGVLRRLTRAERDDPPDDVVLVDGAGVERPARAAAQPSVSDSLRVPEAAAIGMPLGRGRIVLLADPDWLRNDVVRVCRWDAGVRAVRMLDWLAAGGTQRTLVFDEWHQGHGVHASAGGALREFLAGDPRGRVLAQATLAALLLLAALGPRALTPAARDRVERRSPFEHVGALARAYEEVGATRVVAQRLVRGLRRRLAGSATRAATQDDAAFLAMLEARHPALAPDLALVRDALATTRTPAALLEVGRAVARIERHIVKA